MMRADAKLVRETLLKVSRPAVDAFDRLNPWNVTGDNAITPDLINALRIYRSPDDVEMSLPDQLRVMADRIEEDKRPS